MADELDVHPSNVQRDYIFGWILAGIYSESDLGTSLILKGGNCLRKAYFEAARYSGDLDFTLEGPLPQQEAVIEQLNRVCDHIEAKTGVHFDISRTRMQKKSVIDQDRQVHEARLYFRDFFGDESEIVLSIRMDISEHEKLQLPVQTRNIIHPYSDRGLLNVQVKCMKLEEMLAAKLKCLIQRRHSADLYDFVNATFISPTIEINRNEVISAFLKKTIFSSGPGVVKDILLGLPFEALQDLWKRYLVIPQTAQFGFDRAVEGFKSVVSAWFEGLPKGQGTLAFFPADMRNTIIEAGYRQTLLHVVYGGVSRDVEPYSLKYKTRKNGIGREYLYVYDRSGGRKHGPGIKSFVHQKIEEIKNTDQEFEPRFEIELSKAGQFFKERFFQGSPQRRLGSISRRRSSARYVIECPVCGKRFYRQKYSTKLNPHKDPYGNRCFGKHGMLV